MYAKIFTSIYQGTLRGDTHGLVVFTNLLAHADAEGWVDIHPRAIAEEVGLTVDQVRVALAALEAPDPESRSPEEEGRRIVRLDEHRDWGWRIVNHAKYRSIRNEEERREQNRLAQQRWREKNKPSVSTSKHDKPIQKQKQKHIQKQKQEDQKHEQQAARFDEFWSAYPNRKGKSEALAKWKARGLDAIADTILADVTLRKAKDKDWLRGYPPHGSTYVNSKGWEDDIPTIRQENGNGTHQPAESASGRAERKGNEHLARLEEAERRGNGEILAAHGRDLRA